MPRVLPLLTALALVPSVALAQPTQTLESGDLKVTLTRTQPDPSHNVFWSGQLKIQKAEGAPLSTESKELGGAALSQLSPDGRWISVIHYFSGYAQLWDTAAAKRKFTLLAHDKLSNYARIAAFSPDSSRVVFYSFPYELSLWDTATGRRVKLLSDMRKMWWLADGYVVFSPDGKTFAVTGSGAGAQLFDTHSGKLLQTFDQPWTTYGPGYKTGFWRGSIAPVFSPDSKKLAVLYAGGEARLYDLMAARAIAKGTWATGKLRLADRDWVGPLTFDGRTLSGTAPNNWGQFSLKF